VYAASSVTWKVHFAGSAQPEDIGLVADGQILEVHLEGDKAGEIFGRPNCGRLATWISTADASPLRFAVQPGFAYFLVERLEARRR
jgi:hypothetical protein